MRIRKVLPFLIVIAITVAFTIVIYSASADDTEYEEGVIRTTLASGILGEERELIIHLPRGYDSTRTYPVMYVLDGGSQDRHVAAKLEVLTVAGYSPEMIIVGIPNMSAENREKNLTPPFMRRDNENKDSALGDADAFLSFMKTELIPFMQRNYATSSTRLISGNSRGGLLAMYSLLYEAGLFQARFCYSTPFWRQDNILVSRVGAFLATTDTLNTFIYLSAGRNETENIRNGLNNMTKAIRDNAPVGLVLYTDLTPNATHHDNAMISASAGIARWSEYYAKQKK